MGKIAILKSDYDTEDNKTWFGHKERHRWKYLYTQNWRLTKYEEIPDHSEKVKTYMKRVAREIVRVEGDIEAIQERKGNPPAWYWNQLKFLRDMEKKIVEIQEILEEKLREGGGHAAESKHHEVEEAPAPAAEA